MTRDLMEDEFSILQGKIMKREKKEEGKKKAVKSDREIENGKSGKGNSSYTKLIIVCSRLLFAQK